MNDVLLRYSQGLPVFRVEDGGRLGLRAAGMGVWGEGGVEEQWLCVGLLSFLLW